MPSNRRAHLLLCRVAVHPHLSPGKAAGRLLCLLQTQQEGDGRGPEPVPGGKLTCHGERREEGREEGRGGGLYFFCRVIYNMYSTCVVYMYLSLLAITTIDRCMYKHIHVYMYCTHA